MPPSFGALLRDWRQNRRLTQEQLALEAQVSTRHLSYLENGRAQPNREMVLLLARVLDIPLREKNPLLVSAGFAPIYRETDYDAPEMTSIRRAVDFLLERHEPYGAIVIDSAWTMRQANQGAWRILAAFAPELPRTLPLNLLRLLIANDGLKRILKNWEEVLLATLERTPKEAVSEGPRGPAAQILAEITPFLPPLQPTVEPLALVVPLHLVRDQLELKLFSTITTLGTPADVTAQTLRIETWFPADAASDRWLTSEVMA